MHRDLANAPLRVRGACTWIVAVVFGACTLPVLVFYIIVMMRNDEWPASPERQLYFRRYSPRVVDTAANVAHDLKDAQFLCARRDTLAAAGWFCVADLTVAGAYLDTIGDVQLAALGLVPAIALVYAALVCLIAPAGLATRLRLIVATAATGVLGLFIAVALWVTTARLASFNTGGYGDSVPPPASWDWAKDPLRMYAFACAFSMHWVIMTVIGCVACALPLDPKVPEHNDTDMQPADVARDVPAFSPKLADLIGGKDDVRAFLQRERVRTFADLEDCLTWGVPPGSREGAWLWKTRDHPAMASKAEGDASIILFIRQLVEQRCQQPEFQKLCDELPLG